MRFVPAAQVRSLPPSLWMLSVFVRLSPGGRAVAIGICRDLATATIGEPYEITSGKAFDLLHAFYRVVDGAGGR